MKIRAILTVGVAFSTAAVSSIVCAKESITVNDVEYTCENHCVVNVNSSTGKIFVTDSRGGFVYYIVR